MQHKILLGVFGHFFWVEICCFNSKSFFWKTGGTRFQPAIPFQDPPQEDQPDAKSPKKKPPSGIFLCFLVRKRGNKNEKTAKVTGVFRPTTSIFVEFFQTAKVLRVMTPSCQLNMQNKCQKIHTPFTWQFCWWPFWDGDLWPFQCLSNLFNYGLKRSQLNHLVVDG